MIDHLIYTTSVLEKGMSEIEKLLGTAPVIGGRHPKYGTHNALVSLGELTYLEIIAPDPELPSPPTGRWLENSYSENSKLTTWVLQAKDIHAVQAHAVENDLALGTVEDGSRETPDGTTISWKLSNPYALPYDGAIPFLINWGDTTHPAEVAPRAGELVSLTIEHPEAEAVKKSLDLIDANAMVVQASTFRLVAKIETVKGIVTLA